MERGCSIGSVNKSTKEERGKERKGKSGVADTAVTRGFKVPAASFLECGRIFRGDWAFCGFSSPYPILYYVMAVCFVA